MDYYPIFYFNVAGLTDNLLLVQAENNCWRSQTRDSALLDQEATAAAYYAEKVRIKSANNIIEIGD